MSESYSYDLPYREWVLWDGFRSKNCEELGKLTAAGYSQDYDTQIINNVPTIMYPIVCNLTLEYERGEEHYDAFNVENFTWKFFICLLDWQKMEFENRIAYNLVWNDHIFKLSHIHFSN